MFLKICPIAEKGGGWRGVGGEWNLALESSCFASCLEEQEEFRVLDAASTCCIGFYVI